jgi:hypothetical protein
LESFYIIRSIVHAVIDVVKSATQDHYIIPLNREIDRGMADEHHYYCIIQKEMKRVNREIQQFASSRMSGGSRRAGPKRQPKFQPGYFVPMDCEITIPYSVNHLQYKGPSYAMRIPFIYWNDEMKNYFDTTTTTKDLSDPDQYNEKTNVFLADTFKNYNPIPLSNKL